MISTAGGMSELTNPLIVQGGCQGSATMSPFWAIATTPMLKLATSIGGKGYKFTGIPKLLQKLGYVDDNAVLANRILEGAETAQVLIIMQAIMKIRVQGAKSNTIISQATHTKIMKEVENWYKQNSSPPETQLYTGIKGRAWLKTKRPLGKRNIPETPETPGTSHDMIVDTLLERNTLQNPREPWGFTFNNKFTIQTLKRNSTAEKKGLKEGELLGENLCWKHGDETQHYNTVPVTLHKKELQETESITIILKRNTEQEIIKEWGLTLDNDIILKVRKLSIAAKKGLQTQDRILNTKTETTNKIQTHKNEDASSQPYTLFSAPYIQQITMTIQRKKTIWIAHHKKNGQIIGSKTPISKEIATIMAATHNAFTITVLALDNLGVIRPTELNTIIPNKNEQGETIEDYAKYLGVKASFHQALATHQNTLSATVSNACNSAASVSTSLQDLTQVSNLTYSNIDFALSTVPVTPSIVDEMRCSLAKAGHNSIGLSHCSKSADRTSSIAICSRVWLVVLQCTIVQYNLSLIVSISSSHIDIGEMDSSVKGR